MKKFLRKLEFYFEYYIGYFLYSGTKDWSKYIITKYPEQFPNEANYLKQKEEEAL